MKSQWKLSRHLDSIAVKCFSLMNAIDHFLTSLSPIKVFKKFEITILDLLVCCIPKTTMHLWGKNQKGINLDYFQVCQIKSLFLYASNKISDIYIIRMLRMLFLNVFHFQCLHSNVPHFSKRISSQPLCANCPYVLLK